MDSKIVQDFSRLRVLQRKSINSMDDLAQDLTTALEESTSNNPSPLNQPSKVIETRKSEGGEEARVEKEDVIATQLALPSNKIHSKRRAWRRRCKSTSNLSSLGTVGVGKSKILNQSEESSTNSDEDLAQVPPNILSSRGEKGTSSLQLTDSDDAMDPCSSTNKVVPNRSKDHGIRKKRSGTEQGALTGKHLPIESDSVNENFSPTIRPHTKRKRKFKRMALDPDPTGSGLSSIQSVLMSEISHPSSASFSSSNSFNKRQKVRYNQGYQRNPQQQLGLVSGKRKRSNREKSVEPEHLLVRNINSTMTGPSSISRRAYKTLSRPNPSSMSMDCGEDDAKMDMDDSVSSSSLSSSEWASDADSDFGGESANNGREADDEQSDWPGAYEGICSGPMSIGATGGPVFTDDEEADVINSLLSSGLSSLGSGDPVPMTATARQAYMARMKRLAECVPGREIRAGTRKVRNRQLGFLIKSSSSEQLSRFLQDPTRSELKLNVIRALDRNKIMHLANLYSLSVRCEGTNLLVLSKTGKTVRLREFAVPEKKAPIEFKRRRRTPPNSPLLEGSSTSNEPPTSPQDFVMYSSSKQIDTPKQSDSSPTVSTSHAILMNRSESPLLGASEPKNTRVKYSGSLSS